MKVETVARDYQPQYPNPIHVRAGERIHLGRRDEEFPDWRWCRSAAGLEGWVPIAIIMSLSAEEGEVIEDYNALELAVRAGEQVVVERRLGGWAFVRNASRMHGWVPEDHLATRYSPESLQP